MDDLVFSLQEFLKIAPGLCIFPIAFYLAWKKIGSKIIVYYSIAEDRRKVKRFEKIVMCNMKDKPVTIFSIDVVLDGDLFMNIENLEPPVVIKALESVTIVTKPCSGYTYSQILSEEQWGFDPFDFNNKPILMYLTTDQGIVKAIVKSPPKNVYEKHGQIFPFGAEQASLVRMEFNGVMHEINDLYAIKYEFNSQSSVAFVSEDGFVFSDRSIDFGRIPNTSLRNKEGIDEYLKNKELSGKFSAYSIHELPARLQEPLRYPR